MRVTVKEWPEFTKRGEEKFVWVISMKSAGASVLGFIIGQRVAEFLALRGWELLGFSLILMVACGALVTQVRGMLLIQRLVIIGWARIRQIMGQPARISSRLLWNVQAGNDPELQPVIVREDGIAIIRPAIKAHGES